jgi:hypothetical protein
LKQSQEFGVFMASGLGGPSLCNRAIFQLAALVLQASFCLRQGPVSAFCLFPSDGHLIESLQGCVSRLVRGTCVRFRSRLLRSRLIQLMVKLTALGQGVQARALLGLQHGLRFFAELGQALCVLHPPGVGLCGGCAMRLFQASL